MKLIHLSINSRYCRNFATALSKTNKSKWNSVVGLEVHAQISSKSKLFSGAEVAFGAPTNSCVAPFDMAMPGTLPVLNKRCVLAGIQAALALSCTVNPVSMFDRKHYFYADLPAGYQITQQRAPLANNGKVTFNVLVPGKKPYQKSVRLHQLQLEQDSGKSIHDPIGKRSLIDLNRAGNPLMELVFDPHLTNGEEAAALVKELILILTRIGVCSCKMEEGALRVDANVSINKHGDELGIRSEVKNIGSIRGVADAVDYEIQRQVNLVESGEQVKNETRSWDAISKKTVAMRDKEVLQDYRFMPEPNLPPLRLNVNPDYISSKLINVEEIRRSLPELPEETRKNLTLNYNLREETSVILVNEPILLKYFHEVLKTNPTISSVKVANFLINDFTMLCHKNKISFHDCKISVENLAELMTMLHDGTINAKLSQLILQEMLENPCQTPSDIANTNNWKQIKDLNEIKIICQQVVDKYPAKVEQYKKGKEKILRHFAGEIAKMTEQRANMELVVETLKTLLKK